MFAVALLWLFISFWFVYLFVETASAGWIYCALVWSLAFAWSFGDSSFYWLGCPCGGVLPLQFTWLVVPPAGVSSGVTYATRCGLLVMCLPQGCVKTVPYSGTHFLPCKGKPHCDRRFAPLHSRKQVRGLLALKHSTGGAKSCSIKSHS